VNFRDAQLQKCYDNQLAEAGEISGNLRQMCALIATHDPFQMFEGTHSARVHETIERLLSAQMRLALRRWYQRPGAGADCATVELRGQLSRLAGERLENANENTDKPA
jgi:hypothetical protein